MKITLIILIIFTLFQSSSQNLVPNPSFEDYSSCNFGMGSLDSCLSWFQIKPSPDYYNSCIQSTYPNSPDIPFNNGGFQQSRTGNGMIGLFASERIYGGDSREYAHVQLTEPLVSAQNYYVQFYVNLSNNSHYAVKTLGAYLDDSIPLFCSSCWVQSRFVATPQILHNGSGAITDTVNWIRVSGWYQSPFGGEKYLTIGNFNTDSLSYIQNLLSNNEGRSYYYIEDVCISHDSLDCTDNVGIVELTKLNKKLIKIIDTFGRETDEKPFTLLIYIYNDGTTKKLYRIE